MEIFSYIEAVCIVIFTLEYSLRICTSFTEAKYGVSRWARVFRYARTFMNLIDFATVLPYYLGLILGEAVTALRVLRLMRVVRLLKLAKHHPGIQLCVEAMVESGLPLAILMFFNIIFGVIFASAMFYFEGSEFSVDPQFTNSSFPTGVFVRKDPDGADILTPFRSIPVALWWVFTTTTTVGYGDMAPTSHIGRALGVLCFYIGIIFLALPIGVLSANFEAAYARYLERKHKNAPKLLEVAQEHLMAHNGPKRISMFYELKRSDSRLTRKGFSRSCGPSHVTRVLRETNSRRSVESHKHLETRFDGLMAATTLLRRVPGEMSPKEEKRKSQIVVDSDDERGRAEAPDVADVASPAGSGPPMGLSEHLLETQEEPEDELALEHAAAAFLRSRGYSIKETQGPADKALQLQQLCRAFHKLAHWATSTVSPILEELSSALIPLAQHIADELMREDGKESAQRFAARYHDLLRRGRQREKTSARSNSKNEIFMS
eukprot:symbB.v1.2.026450.t1/scaffold2645.1/size74211/3